MSTLLCVQEPISPLITHRVMRSIYNSNVRLDIIFISKWFDDLWQNKDKLCCKTFPPSYLKVYSLNKDDDQQIKNVLVLCTPPSRAKQGLAHSDLYQVTTGWTVSGWSWNGSHLLTGRVLVYWTYKVSILGYGRTKWMATMYSKHTVHISSSGSHFLTTWFLVYWT